MKRTRPTDFAKMVPTEFRDEAVAVTTALEQAQDQNAAAARTAEKIDVMREKKEPSEAARAMRADDAAKLNAQLKNDREHAADKKLEARTGKRSRRQRKADAWSQRGDKLRSRMVDHVQKYAQKLRELGQHDADPTPVPPDVHRVAELIMADPTGHMARVHIAQLPRHKARQLMQAALHPDPYQGKRQQRGRTLRTTEREKLDGNRRHWSDTGTRRWTHPAAIRTIAVACALFRLSGRTRRKGYARVTRGIPRPLVCSFAQDSDTGVRPCTNTLFGNLRGVPGAVRALERVGFFEVDQPPGSKVSARDRGPSGYAFNVYWFKPYVLTPEPPPLSEDDELERLAAAGLTWAEATGADPPAPS
jgi:hypothetical protein